MKIKLLLAPILALFFLLTVRLLHLQVLQGADYRDLADRNRFFRQVVPAERGIIYDRYQQPLVKNKKLYFRDIGEGLYSPQEAITADQALQLMTQQPEKVSYELRRHYLYPTQLAHVLGYTAPATAQDLIGNKQLRTNDWLGRMGLEQQFDHLLRGQDGHQVYEVNTLGEKQRLLSEKKPTAGHDLYTNFDPYLAKIAYESLGQMKGAAVVLDAETGGVLAMVSKPSFNPNDLSSILLDASHEQQRQLNLKNYLQNEDKVFFNRAVNGTYAPGSIFKLVTALAGLENEAFDEHQTVLDEGVLKVGDYSYANWLYTQRGATDGEIALVRAIARSNDIYFYKAAEWTGPTTIAQQAREFGFGQIANIELPSEAAGIVPDPVWKEETTGERWFLGNTYHFGIGQGDMLVSPLQAAQMVQALFKEGERCQPRLIDNAQTGISEQQLTDNCKGMALDQKNLELVLKGMIAACQPGGTASLLFDLNQGVVEANQAESAYDLLQQGAVACKTGTSEFGGLDEQDRYKTHGWFVAATTIEVEEMVKALEQRAEAATSREDEMTISGQLTADELEQWAAQIKEQGFPSKVVLTALVESDEAIPYKEGSHHAAPIVKELLEWMGK